MKIILLICLIGIILAFTSRKFNPSSDQSAAGEGLASTPALLEPEKA